MSNDRVKVGGRVRLDTAAALGTAPIGRLLWHTCSLTTLSVGVYGIYALTNAWFVARGVGEEALAAVNIAAPLLLFAGAISTTVGVGGASLVSRSLGAGRPEDAARAAGNSFVIFWGVAVLTTILGLTFLDPLLHLLGTTEATIGYARPYAMVLVCGAVFATGFSAIVRAEGRLRFSTMLWVVAVLVQIILDPLLIFVLKMGVTGAALGTVGGQAVSSLMAIWFFFFQKDRPYKIRPRDLLPRRSTVIQVLSVGAPSFLTSFGAMVMVVLINSRLASSTTLGAATALIAFAVVSRVQTFVATPQIGITQGVQPIISYNRGRGLGQRVDRTLILALRSTLTYSTLMAGLIIAASPLLTGFFLSEPQSLQAATTALRIIALGFVFSGVAPLISAYFQALGSPAPSYIISIGTLLALKLPLVLAFSSLGPIGIWVALPVGELLAATVALLLLWRSKVS